MNKKFHSTLRVISSLLLVSFFFQDVSFAAIGLKPAEFNFFQKPLINFQIPPSVATVEDAVRLSGQKTIFLIQDAHTNESGQSNTAKALEIILKSRQDDGGIKYVFLEAGTGDDSLTFLRDQAPLGKRKEVADSYLKKGVLSGSEYLDLTSDLHFVLWGVENKDLYWKALRAYEAVAKGRDKFEDYLKRIRMSVETLKPRIFNPSLQAFDEKHEKFLREEISLTDYFEVLAAEAQKRNIPLDYFPHLSALKDLKAVEKTIDFKTAGEEQLKALQAASPEDTQALLSASQQTHSPFRFSNSDNKVEKAYYALLEEIVRKQEAKLPLTPSLNKEGESSQSSSTLLPSFFKEGTKGSSDRTLYPNLIKYFSYLKEAEKINPKEILAEQRLLENQIYDSLTQTEDEKNLCKASKNLRALKNLFDLTLTPDEFKTYQDDPKGFDTAFMTGFLNKKIVELRNFYERAVFLENGYEDYVKHAEDFYALTVDRDRAFVENLARKMDSDNQTEAVLIAGGYHTPNLKALLKEGNISYVVVTPQIYHETNHKRYEKLLLSQSQRPLTPSFVKEGTKGSSDKMAIIPDAETSIGRQLVTDLGVGPEKVLVGARLASVTELQAPLKPLLQTNEIKTNGVIIKLERIRTDLFASDTIKGRAKSYIDTLKDPSQSEHLEYNLGVAEKFTESSIQSINQASRGARLASLFKAPSVKKQVQELERRWAEEERLYGIKRDYTWEDLAPFLPKNLPSGQRPKSMAEAVVMMRGPMGHLRDYKEAAANAQLFRKIIYSKDPDEFIFGLGAYSPEQVQSILDVNHYRQEKGLGNKPRLSVYGSGWVLAAVKNADNNIYPDNQLYSAPATQIAASQAINNAAFQTARNTALEGNPRSVEDSLSLYVMDMEAPLGPMHAFNMTMQAIASGTGAFHAERQDPSHKVCGHGGGACSRPSTSQNEVLKAMRLAGDVANIPIVVIGRTDAAHEKFIIADDPLDREFILGHTNDGREMTYGEAVKGGFAGEWTDRKIERGPHGIWTPDRTSDRLYRVRPGVERVIHDELIMAPYTDMMWSDTHGITFEERVRVAEGVHKVYPNKPFADNVSPNLPQTKLTEAEVEQYKQLPAHGYKYLFMTLGSYRNVAYNTFEFASDIANRGGLTALRDLQVNEQKAASRGYRGHFSQQMASGRFWDLVKGLTGVSGEMSFLGGSTEESQAVARPTDDKLGARLAAVQINPQLLSTKITVGSQEHTLAELFGDKNVNGRTINVEQTLARFMQEFEADREGLLPMRLANPVTTYNDLDRVIVDAKGNQRTVRSIIQGAIDNFKGKKTAEAWRLNESVPVPQEFFKPGLQGTGPFEIVTMMIGAMNAGKYGAASWMPDWEDAAPANMYKAWLNLQLLVSGQLDNETFKSASKEYKLELPRNKRPMIVHRVPGLHLTMPLEDMSYNEQPVSATMLGLLMHALNNFDAQKDNGSGIYYYIPKIEQPEEARLVAAMLYKLHDALGIPPYGTIKVQMLNERPEFTLQQFEIEWIMRDFLVSTNVGRWDYGAGRQKMLQNLAEYVFPDMDKFAMTDPTQREYTRENAIKLLLVSANIESEELTNGIPVGGMDAPLKNRPLPKDPEWVQSEKIKVSQGAVRGIFKGKLRERLTGLIVYHDSAVERLYDTYRQSWVATTESEYVEAGKIPLTIELDRNAQSLEGKLAPLQNLVDGLTEAERKEFQDQDLLDEQGKITPYVLTDEDLTVEGWVSEKRWHRLFDRPKGPRSERGMAWEIYMASEYMYQAILGRNAAAIEDYNTGNGLEAILNGTFTGIRLMSDHATNEGNVNSLINSVLHSATLTVDGETTKTGDKITPELFLKLWEKRKQDVDRLFTRLEKEGAEVHRDIADLDMEILKRLVIKQDSSGQWVPQTRRFRYASKIIFSFRFANRDEWPAIMDAIFEKERPELEKAFQDAADADSKRIAEAALKAHDYTLDKFQGARLALTKSAKESKNPLAQRLSDAFTALERDQHIQAGLTTEELYQRAVQGEKNRADRFISQIRTDTSLAKVPQVRALKEAQYRLQLQHGFKTAYGSTIYTSLITNRSAGYTEHLEIDGFKVDTDQRAADPAYAERVLTAVLKFLENKSLIQVDRSVGQNPEDSRHFRLLVSGDYGRLAHELTALHYDPKPSAANDVPDILTIDLPDFDLTTQGLADGKPHHPYVLRVPSLGVNFILGTDYFGEIKKSALTTNGYLAKINGDVSLHAGSKIVKVRLADGRIAERHVIASGLSGTGKTTTLAGDQGLGFEDEEEDSGLLQDDFVELRLIRDPVQSQITAVNVKGLEAGIYYKTERLDPDKEKALFYAAQYPDTILSNVWMKESATGLVPDYNNVSLTANGRGVVTRQSLLGDKYEQYANADMVGIDTVLWLTRSDSIVPPAAILNPEQAAAYWVLGESVITSAATNDPTKVGKPVHEAGFSPFIVGSVSQEANLIREISRAFPDMKVVLFNTGKVGVRRDPATGKELSTGRKIDVPDSAAIVKQIYRGELPTKLDPFWGYQVAQVEGFDPASFYAEPEFDALQQALRIDRINWLNRFPGLDPAIIAAIENTGKGVPPAGARLAATTPSNQPSEAIDREKAAKLVMPAQIILDWLSQNDKLPQRDNSLDLIWAMGSESFRTAVEAAERWQKNKNALVLVTGGVGVGTRNIEDHKRGHDLSDNALADKIFSELHLFLNELADLKDSNAEAFWARMLKEFQILRSKDQERREKYRDRKTWNQTLQFKKSDLAVKSVEELLFDQLLDRNPAVRSKMKVPEGILYAVILKVLGVSKENIVVDAASTSTIEFVEHAEVVFGEHGERKDFKPRSIVLIHRPYSAKKTKGALTNLLTAYLPKWAKTTRIYFHSPYVYKDKESLASKVFTDPRRVIELAVSALYEIDTIHDAITKEKSIRPIEYPEEIIDAYQQVAKILYQGQPKKLNGYLERSNELRYSRIPPTVAKAFDDLTREIQAATTQANQSMADETIDRIARRLEEANYVRALEFLDEFLEARPYKPYLDLQTPRAFQEAIVACVTEGSFIRSQIKALHELNHKIGLLKDNAPPPKEESDEFDKDLNLYLKAKEWGAIWEILKKYHPHIPPAYLKEYNVLMSNLGLAVRKELENTKEAEAARVRSKMVYDINRERSRLNKPISLALPTVTGNPATDKIHPPKVEDIRIFRKDIKLFNRDIRRSITTLAGKTMVVSGADEAKALQAARDEVTVIMVPGMGGLSLRGFIYADANEWTDTLGWVKLGDLRLAQMAYAATKFRSSELAIAESYFNHHKVQTMLSDGRADLEMFRDHQDIASSVRVRSTVTPIIYTDNGKLYQPYSPDGLGVASHLDMVLQPLLGGVVGDALVSARTEAQTRAKEQLERLPKEERTKEKLKDLFDQFYTENRNSIYLATANMNVPLSVPSAKMIGDFHLQRKKMRKNGSLQQQIPFTAFQQVPLEGEKGGVLGRIDFNINGVTVPKLLIVEGFLTNPDTLDYIARHTNEYVGFNSNHAVIAVGDFVDFLFKGTTDITDEDLTSKVLNAKDQKTFRHVLAAINKRMVPIVDSATFLSTDFSREIGVFTEKKEREGRNVDQVSTMLNAMATLGPGAVFYLQPRGIEEDELERRTYGEYKSPGQSDKRSAIAKLDELIKTLKSDMEKLEKKQENNTPAYFALRSKLPRTEADRDRIFGEFQKDPRNNLQLTTDYFSKAGLIHFKIDRQGVEGFEKRAIIEEILHRVSNERLSPNTAAEIMVTRASHGASIFKIDAPVTLNKIATELWKSTYLPDKRSGKFVTEKTSQYGNITIENHPTVLKISIQELPPLDTGKTEKSAGARLAVPQLGPTRPELEPVFMKLVKNSTPAYVKENRLFDIRANKERMTITLKPEHLKKYDAQTNPQGLGLAEWLEDYEKEAMVATAGIRSSQNVLYPWDTRFRVNQVGVALATLGKALVAKELYPTAKLQKMVAGEVRYNTPEYVELIARIQAAQGIKTYLPSERKTTTIWMTSFLTFMYDLVGAEFATSSHANSSFIATKDIDSEGSQYLPEESVRFVGKIREIFDTVKREGEYRFEIASADDPLIDEGLMTQINDGADLYTQYLRNGVATNVNLDRIRNVKKKIIVDNVGGALHRATEPIFERLGINSSFKWLRTEQDPFFHGIGKDMKGEKFIDFTQDTTIIKRDPKTGEVVSIPVMERMGYDSILKDEPVGTTLLMGDPDGDRLVTAQIESSDRAEFLRKVGIDFLRLDDQRILALYSPNQSFFMTMAYHAESLRAAGLWNNHPRFMIMTTASSAAWREWAEKNGVQILNVPVGFKEIAAMQRKIEYQIKTNPDKPVIVRDVFGREVSLGVQPRLLFAGEESGGAVIGPEELIKSNHGRIAIGMREKSDGEMLVIQAAMAAHLENQNVMFSDYLNQLLEQNDIKGRFDVREDVVYYNQSEPDPDKLKEEKTAGELRRTANYVFYLSMALAYQDGKITRPQIISILNDLFAKEGLTFDDLSEIYFVGDGVFFQFPNKVLEIRPSGTDAKSKAYGMGEDKLLLARYAAALGNYSGDLTALHREYVSTDYSDVASAMKLQWDRYQAYYREGLPPKTYVPPTEYANAGARLADNGETSHELIQRFLNSGIRYVTFISRPGAGKGTLMNYLVPKLNENPPIFKTRFALINRIIAEFYSIVSYLRNTFPWFNEIFPRREFRILPMGDYFRGINQLLANDRKPASEKNPLKTEEKKYRRFAKLVTNNDLKDMAEGKLMSNETAINIVNAILGLPEYKNAYGIFFDGFPRTPVQQEAIDQDKILIHEKPLKMDLTVILDADEEVLFNRVVGRAKEDLKQGTTRPDAPLAATGEIDPIATRVIFDKRMRDYNEFTSQVAEHKRGSSDTFQVLGYALEAKGPEEEKAIVRGRFFRALDQFLSKKEEANGARLAQLFENKDQLLEALKGVVTLDSSYNVQSIDNFEALQKLVPVLYYNYSYSTDKDIIAITRNIARQGAEKIGTTPASLANIYQEQSKGLRKFTIPSNNVRLLPLESIQAILRAANKLNAGAFQIELARSEYGYTNITYDQLVTIGLFAALVENYRGPIHFKLDHSSNTEKDLQEGFRTTFKLQEEAIRAGVYNIDIDSSALEEPQVDGKPNMQANIDATVKAALHARTTGWQVAPLQIVTLGGEAGGVGTAQNTTPEIMQEFITRVNQGLKTAIEAWIGQNADKYQELLKARGTQGLDPREYQLNIASGQNATAHGGLFDTKTGKRLESVPLDFGLMDKISKTANDNDAAGYEQHGFSTVPISYYHLLVEHGVAEVHLATAFMETVMDFNKRAGFDQLSEADRAAYTQTRDKFQAAYYATKNYADTVQKQADKLKKTIAKDPTLTQKFPTEEAIVAEAKRRAETDTERRRIMKPYKQLWDDDLPATVKNAILEDLANQHLQIFTELNVKDTMELAKQPVFNQAGARLASKSLRSALLDALSYRDNKGINRLVQENLATIPALLASGGFDQDELKLLRDVHTAAVQLKTKHLGRPFPVLGARLAENLDVATKEISAWKKANAGKFNEPSANPFVTKLQEKAQQVYNEKKIYSLRIGERIEFVRSIYDPDNFKDVATTIESIFREYGKDLNEPTASLSPAQYNELAKKFSVYEQEYSINDYHDIRVAVSFLFDFFRDEVNILEQLSVIDEIDKELKKPGSGNLQQVAAIQDLHGGARRFMALVGYVFGLPADSYKDIQTLDDLETLLLSHHIDVQGANLRVVGLADQYDRGPDPIGVADFVRWLRDQRKAKFFIGNHDFWRQMAVLQVHRLFDPKVYNDDQNKNHHIASWSSESFVHTGWGDIELDQINQKRFNEKVVLINNLIAIFNNHLPLGKKIEEFKKLSLDKVRERFEIELKTKKAKNQEIRKLKQSDPEKKNAEIQAMQIEELPNIFENTLEEVTNSIVAYNKRIRALNAVYVDQDLNLPEIEFNVVNLDNYHRDPEVIERTLWELKNFRLFYVDIYGNLHMHNILPFKKMGGFDVSYKGREGLEALELMSQKVREFFQEWDTIPDTDVFREKMWNELGDILEIINSWYSDKPGYVYAKAENVKDFIDRGGLERLGVGILGHSTQIFAPRKTRHDIILGHNERAKFEKINAPYIYPYPSIGSAIIHIDYEMSPGYSDRGAILTRFMRDAKTGKITGRRVWGYKTGSDVIQDLTLEGIDGLDDAQKQMIRDHSDGVQYMKWYKAETLKFLADELRQMNLRAESQNRPDKAQAFRTRMQQVIAASTEGARLAQSYVLSDRLVNISTSMFWYKDRIGTLNQNNFATVSELAQTQQQLGIHPLLVQLNGLRELAISNGKKFVNFEPGTIVYGKNFVFLIVGRKMDHFQGPALYFVNGNPTSLKWFSVPVEEKDLFESFLTLNEFGKQVSEADWTSLVENRDIRRQIRAARRAGVPDDELKGLYDGGQPTVQKTLDRINRVLRQTQLNSEEQVAVKELRRQAKAWGWEIGEEEFNALYSSQGRDNLRKVIDEKKAAEIKRLQDTALRWKNDTGARLAAIRDLEKSTHLSSKSVERYIESAPQVVISGAALDESKGMSRTRFLVFGDKQYLEITIKYSGKAGITPYEITAIRKNRADNVKLQEIAGLDPKKFHDILTHNLRGARLASKPNTDFLAYENRLAERQRVFTNFDSKLAAEILEKAKSQTRFSPDTTIKPFYGLTTIAWVRPESGLHKKLVQLQKQIGGDLAAEGFDKKFAFLEPSSFHMTIADIDPSKVEYPQTDKLIPGQVAHRIRDAKKAFQTIGAPGQVKANVRGIGFTGVITALVRFKPNELTKVLRMESAIQSATNTEVRKFTGHISLAYFVDPDTTENELRRIIEILKKYQNRSLGGFTIESFDLTSFSDMNHFTPLVTRDLASNGAPMAIQQVPLEKLKHFKAVSNLRELLALYDSIRTNGEAKVESLLNDKEIVQGAPDVPSYSVVMYFGVGGKDDFGTEFRNSILSLIQAAIDSAGLHDVMEVSSADINGPRPLHVADYFIVRDSNKPVPTLDDPALSAIRVALDSVKESQALEFTRKPILTPSFDVILPGVPKSESAFQLRETLETELQKVGIDPTRQGLFHMTLARIKPNVVIGQDKAPLFQRLLGELENVQLQVQGLTMSHLTLDYNVSPRRFEPDNRGTVDFPLAIQGARLAKNLSFSKLQATLPSIIKKASDNAVAMKSHAIRFNLNGKLIWEYPINYYSKKDSKKAIVESILGFLTLHTPYNSSSYNVSFGYRDEENEVWITSSGARLGKQLEAKSPKLEARLASSFQLPANVGARLADAKLVHWLVVEDFFAYSERLVKELKQLGVGNINVVEKAEDALALIEAAPDFYSVIILDHELKGLSGAWLLDELKSKGLAARKVLVGNSNSSFHNDQFRYKGATFATKLGEKFEAAALLTNVQKALSSMPDNGTSGARLAAADRQSILESVNNNFGRSGITGFFRNLRISEVASRQNFTASETTVSSEVKNVFSETEIKDLETAILKIALAQPQELNKLLAILADTGIVEKFRIQRIVGEAAEGRKIDRVTATLIESKGNVPFITIDNARQKLQAVHAAESDENRNQFTVQEMFALLKASELNGQIALTADTATVPLALDRPLSLFSKLSDDEFKVQLELAIVQDIETHVQLARQRKEMQFFYSGKKLLTPSQQRIVDEIEQWLLKGKLFIKVEASAGFKGVVIEAVDIENQTNPLKNDGTKIFIPVGGVNNGILLGLTRLNLMAYAVGSFYSHHMNSGLSVIEFEKVAPSDLSDEIVSFYSRNLKDTSKSLDHRTLAQIFSGEAHPDVLRQFIFWLPIAAKIPFNTLFQGARMALKNIGIAA